MPLPLLRYNTTGAVPYVTSQTVIRVANCNGFTAVNTGDTIATVNDQVLYPGTIGTNVGDSMTVGGNAGEIFIGVITIIFVVPVGANPQVSINQKFYIID